LYYLWIFCKVYQLFDDNMDITSYLKIILVVLMNTQVEASQESFQHDIHILQPSAYNFEARQTTAQPSIFADIDEVYVHLEYASFFG